MARVVVINILLILAPFLFYSAYILIEKKPETKGEFWNLIPSKLLFAIGLIFMGIFYVTQISFQTPIKDGVYHPAEVRDGKIIPGYVSAPEPVKAVKKPIEDKTDTKSTKEKPEPAQDTEPPQKKAPPATERKTKNI